MKDLFPIPLLQESLNLTNNNLYQEIKHQRSFRPKDRTNYTSYYDKNPMEGVNWEELHGLIINHSRTFLRTVAPKSPLPRNYKINAWWNLYDVHNHHCWHAHGRSLLSGTYYVYFDETSVPIEFRSPIESLTNSWLNLFGTDTRWAQSLQIFPAQGDLLMWPSWLDHCVPEQKRVGDNLRCTISFNVMAKYDN